MSPITEEKKHSFWLKWTFLNTLAFIVAFAVSGVIMLSYFTNPGYAMGTHFEESRNTIVFQSIVGVIIGFVQWVLLRKLFKVSWLWIFINPIIIIVVDGIIFAIFGNMNIHWGEFSDTYLYSTSILIFVECLVIGSIQSILLKRYFTTTYSWILASSVPWAASLVVTVFGTTPIIWITYFVLALFWDY